MAQHRPKLSPAERHRLIMRWTRIYMVGIYVLTLGGAVVVAPFTAGGWAYPAVGVCLLGLAFPPVAAARGTSTLPDLTPLRPFQLKTLKRFTIATGALVFATIVFQAASSRQPPVELWAPTVAAGVCSAFYSLAVLIA